MDDDPTKNDVDLFAGLLEGMAQLAAGTWAFRMALTAEGFTDEDALELSKEWLRSVIQGAVK